ncbi:MAG: hypothetical protein C0392_03535 [Syntrophus sp. (in: bacteria)]|nr:hypothetical protein [Syntrophus sp. (in: bacteria)]
MNFPFRLGLKLYSTNTDLIKDVLALKDIFYDFIELYIIPGSYKKTINEWKMLDIPYVIHAPHFFHGVNLAQAERMELNLRSYRETIEFADCLDSSIIIAHGGNNGSLRETIRQLILINDNRILIENKPKVGLNDELCIGWSAAEIQRICDEGMLRGIALDFVHASCAANSSNIDTMTLVEELMLANPRIYHLSDGDILSEKDMHYNLGMGSLNLSNFISIVPVNSLLTLETPRDPSMGLLDFVHDVNYLNKIANK